MKELVDVAERENRDLSTEEEVNWASADEAIKSLDKRISRQELLERTPASPERRLVAPGEHAILNNTKPGQARALPEYRDAFDKWVVYGKEPLDLEERKLLSLGAATANPNELRAIGVSNPTGAGYLVPTEYERTIMQNMLAFGGMRSVATVMTTDNGADLDMPTSDDTGNVGELLAESATATEQDVTVGVNVLKAFYYGSKVVRVTYELLQDSAFNVEGWLAGLLAERVARITNTHFTVGTGGNQPLGVVLSAAAGVAGVTGQSTSVAWDDLINLEHTIDPAYRRDARFMFHDNTLSYLRRLKDGEGRYIWQPGTTVGAPGSINGWPYVINQDVAQMAASAKSILFGNFRAYTIRDVRGFALIRLDELYALQRQVAFVGFSRHDGRLLHAGTVPVKTFANSAS